MMGKIVLTWKLLLFPVDVLLLILFFIGYLVVGIFGKMNVFYGKLTVTKLKALPYSVGYYIWQIS